MRRARILVVDDNRINRRLLAGVLEAAGHRVDQAGSGGEAVDGVRLFAYDLVLMDVQMPGMDGIVATKAIRSFGGDRGRVPIIGISGDVGEDVVARCRAAGMSDQLAKPVGLDVLQRAVEQWSGTADRSDPSAAALGGLADGLAPEVLRSLLGDFGADACRRSAELEGVVGTGELRRARAIAHDLGGAAANLGLSELSRVARALEIACDDGGDRGELARLVAELPKVLADAEALVAEHRARLAPASTGERRDGARDAQ